jgi:hypothetical protein
MQVSRCYLLTVQSALRMDELYEYQSLGNDLYIVAVLVLIRIIQVLLLMLIILYF